MGQQSADSTETTTVRGRVAVIRGSRVAVVSLRGTGSQFDEYDSDIPLSCLPRDVREGDEVEFTVRLIREKAAKKGKRR